MRLLVCAALLLIGTVAHSQTLVQPFSRAATGPSGGSYSVFDRYQGSPQHFLNTAGNRTLRTSAYSSDNPVVNASATGSFRVDTDALSEAAAQQESEPVLAPPAEDTPTYSRKSPVKAFFLSLLLPGLGEMYAGHTIRGGVFMAIEATAWSTWAIFRGKGQDWEDKYIDYRNEHWSFERYDAYRNAVWDDMCAIAPAACGLDTFGGASPSRPLWLRQDDSVAVLVGSHHYDEICGREMPSSHDQNEMIGKYNRFSYGWDDIGVHIPEEGIDSTRLSLHFSSNIDGIWGTDEAEWAAALGGRLVSVGLDETTAQLQVQYIGNTYSEHRTEYESMRNKSNDAKGIAGKMTAVILINHVFSAIQAARLTSAANRNNGLVERPDTFLRMTLMESRNEFVPMLMFRRYF